MIELFSNDWKLWIDPNYGASVLGLQWKDLWVMPDRRLADRSPVRFFSERGLYPEASFILLPWSNRIRSGVLFYEGERFQQERPEEHALHGEAWNKVWEVSERSNSGIVLTFTRPKMSLFPAEYKAEYKIEIKENNLTQKLTITNFSSFGFYFGLGFHPYFSKFENTSLKIKGALQYPMGEETGLPIGSAKITNLTEKMAKGILLSDELALDDCFKLSEKKAEIYWKDLRKKIEVQFFGDVSHLVIYNPKDPCFALEPVSHANNAFGDFELAEKKTVPPGESLSVGYCMSMTDVI